MNASAIKTLLRMHWVNVRLSIRIFWAILLFVGVLAFALVSIFGNAERTNVNTSAIAAITIYLLVSSLIVVSETFPLALGMSFRRKDYYASAVLLLTGLTLAFTTVSWLLMVIEQRIAEWLGVRVTVFTVGDKGQISVTDQLSLYLGAGLFVIAVGFFLGLLHYRFGKTGVLTAAGIFLVLIVLLHLGGGNPLVEWYRAAGSLKGFMATLLIPAALLFGAGYPLTLRMGAKG